MKRGNKNLAIILIGGGLALYLLHKNSSGGAAVSAAKTSAVTALASLLPTDNNFLNALNALSPDQAVALYNWNLNGRPSSDITSGSMLQGALRSFINNGNYFIDDRVSPLL